MNLQHFTMEVQRLFRDELVYEVAIRGKTYDAAQNRPSVNDLRKELRALLAAEANGDELEDALLPVKVDDEVLILEAKIEDVASGIEGLKEKAEGAPHPHRVRTVLSHCNKRLQRVFDNAKGQQRESVKPLFGQLKAQVTAFRACGTDKVFVEATIVPSVSGPRDDYEKEDGSGSDDDSSSRGASHHSSGPKRRGGGNGGAKGGSNKSLDFHKWGISFSGTDDESVLSFIMDVEEKANWKGVKFNLLVAGAAEFFTGRAKTWFRSVKSKVDSWNELKIALRSEFLPMDYYEGLWEEIRLRKQGQSESVGAYVANMLALFERLEMIDVIREELKLSMIRKNLNPFFTQGLALTEVLSLDHLKTLGRQLEVSQARVLGYSESGKGKAKSLEPEFAFKQPSVRKATVHALAAERPDLTGDVPKSLSLSCYNCGKVGHKFSQCEVKSDKKFCYKCGRKDVTVRNCPKCGGKGKFKDGGESPSSKKGE